MEIERFQHTTPNHLAFGYGVHRCIGSNLSLREARIALETLSQRLANLRLQPNQEFNYIPTMVFRGLTNLYVDWDLPPTK